MGVGVGLENDLAFVAEDEAVDFGAAGAALDGDVAAEEAAADAAGDVEDFALRHEDAVLDFAVTEKAVLADGGEGADEGVFEDAVGAEHDGAADGASRELAAGADDDATAELVVAEECGAVVAFDVLEEEAVGVEDVFGLTGVAPPAFEAEGEDFVAGGDEVGEGVGDLEFPACGGLNGVDGFVDGGGEEVNAGDGEIALGLGGLFGDADDGSVGSGFRDAEAAGIGDGVDHEGGGGAVEGAGAEEVGDAVLEEVVAEVHDEGVAGEEVAGDGDGVGEAAGVSLDDVGDLGVPALSGADGFGDVGVVGADDQADVVDASLDEVFDDVEEDGFVGDGDEVFGASVGEGAETGALSRAKNEAFHRRYPLESGLGTVYELGGGDATGNGREKEWRIGAQAGRRLIECLQSCERGK